MYQLTKAVELQGEEEVFVRINVHMLGNIDTIDAVCVYDSLIVGLYTHAIPKRANISPPPTPELEFSKNLWGLGTE
jgi:hypothetical protein